MAATQEAADAAPTTKPSLIERLEGLCMMASLLAMMMMRLGVLDYTVPWLSLHMATVIAFLVFALATLDTCKAASAKVSMLSCLLFVHNNMKLRLILVAATADSRSG
jgi:uncharacterized membrane protein SirB2